MSMDKNSKIVYCSIDFGTAGTGCAIGTNSKGIYEHSWANSENRVGSDRSKTRTAVLVNAADYSPVAFGDQAYDVYEERLSNNSDKARKELLFFDYFKMSLSDDSKSGGGSAINRRMTVTSTTGETAPATKIFSAAFKAIHKSVFDKLTHSSNGRIKPRDIVWIITVPTLWSEAAKQLMREAARSGFPDTDDSQIKIAREPEAAALCCRAQQLERQLQLSSPLSSLSELLKPNSRMVVADLGAGTADFSELGVSTDGTLVETAAASGGPWGGHLIEKRLLEVLEIAFGKEAMTKFRQENPAEFHELERNIRNLKHRVDPNGSMPYRLMLPYRLIEDMDLRNNIVKFQELTGELELPITNDYHKSIPSKKKGDDKADVKEMDVKAVDNGSVSSDVFEGGKAIRYTDGGLLKLSHSFVMSLFEAPKSAIVRHLNRILDSNPTASTLFLVGGFSESKVIQQSVDQLLADRTRLNQYQQLSASDIILAVRGGSAAAAPAPSDQKSPKAGTMVPVRVLPLHPGLCVMNGAVHYGMNPHLVSHRISKMSFGIQAAEEWDERTMGIRHKEYRMRRGRLEPYCSSIFSRFCEVGDLVEVDFKKVRTFKPSEDNQERVSLKIMATPKKGVQFVDDPSVITIGSVALLIPLPPQPAAKPPSSQSAGAAAAYASAPDTGCDRDIVISMSFGCTEISVTAHEARSGESVECTVDCLDFELDASAAKLARK